MMDNMQNGNGEDEERVEDERARDAFAWILQNSPLTLKSIWGLLTKLRSLGKHHPYINARSLKLVLHLYNGSTNKAKFIHSSKGSILTMRMLRDLSQIVFGKARSRMSLDDWFMCHKILSKCMDILCTIKTSARQLLENRVRRLFPGQQNIQQTTQAAALNNDPIAMENPVERRYPVGSNILFPDVYLVAADTKCPECNEEMNLKEEYSCIVLSETAEFLYGRHPIFRCQRKDCGKNPSRTYDSMCYSENFDENNSILYRKLLRTPGRYSQKFYGKPEYIQVSSRWFISRNYVEKLSLRIVTCRSTFTSEAKALVYQTSDSSFKNMPTYLKDKVFANAVQSLKKQSIKENFHLRKMLFRGFSLRFLEDEWTKVRVGEPRLVKMPLEEVNMRCPKLPDEEDLEPSQNPTSTFQKRFNGTFRTGKIVCSRSDAEQPLRILFEKPLEDALELYVRCFEDARPEESLHTCKKCVIYNTETHRYISVMCGDGTSLTRHCCSSGASEETACRNLPRDSGKRTCIAHDHLNTVCAVSTCTNAVHSPDVLTCGEQQCKDKFMRWKESRKSVRAKVQLYVRENGAPGRRKKIPQLIRDSFLSDEVKRVLQEIAGGNIEIETDDELLEKLLAEADQALASEVGIKSSFGRRFTHMEFTLSRICGHMVFRSTCFRSEALSVVRKALLVVTDGANSFIPTHFVYDRACAFLMRLASMIQEAEDNGELPEVKTMQNKKYTAEALNDLLAKMSYVVDKFHFTKHKHGAHPNLAKICSQECNPDEVKEDSRNKHIFVEGKRIINSERQENVANFLGPFQKMVRSFSALHAEFFLYAVYSIKNEVTFRSAWENGDDPRYLKKQEDKEYYLLPEVDP